MDSVSEVVASAIEVGIAGMGKEQYYNVWSFVCVVAIVVDVVIAMQNVSIGPLCLLLSHLFEAVVVIVLFPLLL